MYLTHAPRHRPSKARKLTAAAHARKHNLEYDRMKAEQAEARTGRDWTLIRGLACAVGLVIAAAFVTYTCDGRPNATGRGSCLVDPTPAHGLMNDLRGL